MRGRGGTGRRAGFRSRWGNSWRFESSRPHHSDIPDGRHRPEPDNPKGTTVLTTSVERLEGNNVKLTVTVSADEVDAADRRRVQVGRQARSTIPGLPSGQGAAPHDRHAWWGASTCCQRPPRSSSRARYPRALDLEALRPIESPEMEELTIVEPGAEYTYEAEVDVRPELTLSSTDDLSVTAPAKEATQAEIDAQIEQARERFATLEPVEDRGVETDDFVLISFVGHRRRRGATRATRRQVPLRDGPRPDAGRVRRRASSARSPARRCASSSRSPTPPRIDEFVGKTAEFDVDGARDQGEDAARGRRRVRAERRRLRLRRGHEYASSSSRSIVQAEMNHLQRQGARSARAARRAARGRGARSR